MHSYGPVYRASISRLSVSLRIEDSVMGINELCAVYTKTSWSEQSCMHDLGVQFRLPDNSPVACRATRDCLHYRQATRDVLFRFPHLNVHKPTSRHSDTCPVCCYSANCPPACINISTKNLSMNLAVRFDAGGRVRLYSSLSRSLEMPTSACGS